MVCIFCIYVVYSVYISCGRRRRAAGGGGGRAAAGGGRAGNVFLAEIWPIIFGSGFPLGGIIGDLFVKIPVWRKKKLIFLLKSWSGTKKG